LKTGLREGRKIALPHAVLGVDAQEDDSRGAARVPDLKHTKS